MDARLETKIFDPAESAGGAELLDATVVQRGGRWQMFLAGQAGGFGPTQLFRAVLPAGAPLAAASWQPVRDDNGALLPVGGCERSRRWDGGGRHCPSYVRGWDPVRAAWVERLYYAGAAEAMWGPYTIGYLEWDGSAWQDQEAPAFVANEAWEHGSVYEPNLLYHDGRWKLWYVAGSNGDDYLVHGYAESPDGRTGWSRHEVFAPAEMKLFDFCVREHAGRFHAVYARVWLHEGDAPPATGLWWCSADQPYASLNQWGPALQMMDARDCGWHRGAWKPSWQVDEADAGRLLIFFDGQYRTDEPGPFPYAFTLGCLQCAMPPAH